MNYVVQFICILLILKNTRLTGKFNQFFIKAFFPINRLYDGLGQPRRPKLVHLFAFDAFYWEGHTVTHNLM